MKIWEGRGTVQHCPSPSTRGPRALINYVKTLLNRQPSPLQTQLMSPRSFLRQIPPSSQETLRQNQLLYQREHFAEIGQFKVELSVEILEYVRSCLLKTFDQEKIVVNVKF